MPYADPEKRREALRESYRRRYADPAFRKQESDRKAAWLQTEVGKASNRETTRRHRKKG